LASKAHGWSETGTIYQYRRLLELGWPASARPFRLADRFLFQILSRIEPNDPDKTVAQRAQRTARRVSEARQDRPCLGLWARQMGREAAACALARAGHADDPRVRGTAAQHRQQHFPDLRSPLVEKPFKKAQGKVVLRSRAYPPTIFAVEMLASHGLLRCQRERAGFIERLGVYFSSPAPRRAYYILAGKKLLKPVFRAVGRPAAIRRSRARERHPLRAILARAAARWAWCARS